MKAVLPDNEIQRLAHLRALNIVDTQREQSFDDITRLAMMVCETPIAVITLIEEDRQWFKSCFGLEATETSRNIAFCAHAILQPEEVLVVEDATRDRRYQ